MCKKKQWESLFSARNRRVIHNQCGRQRLLPFVGCRIKDIRDVARADLRLCVLKTWQVRAVAFPTMDCLSVGYQTYTIILRCSSGLGDSGSDRLGSIIS